MLDRRNPLSPDDERKKRLAWLNHDVALPDQVYGIYYLKNGEKQYFYVGIALRPHNRFKEHIRVAKRGSNTLPEYEMMRFLGEGNYFQEILDERGEFTEEDWKQILIEQGHKLLNVGACVDVKRRLKGRYKHLDAVKGLTTDGKPDEKTKHHSREFKEMWQRDCGQFAGMERDEFYTALEALWLKWSSDKPS